MAIKKVDSSFWPENAGLHVRVVSAQALNKSRANSASSPATAFGTDADLVFRPSCQDLLTDPFGPTKGDSRGRRSIDQYGRRAGTAAARMINSLSYPRKIFVADVVKSLDGSFVGYYINNGNYRLVIYAPSILINWRYGKAIVRSAELDHSCTESPRNSGSNFERKAPPSGEIVPFEEYSIRSDLKVVKAVNLSSLPQTSRFETSARINPFNESHQFLSCLADSNRL